MPFIGFDVAQKRIYGNSGCNRMMGSFEADSLKPGTLKFGQIGSTRMMCPDMKLSLIHISSLQAESVGWWDVKNAVTRDATNGYSDWALLSGVGRVILSLIHIYRKSR